MSQTGLAPIIVVILIAFGAIGYLFYQNQSKQTVPTQPQQTTQISTSDETANWKTYSSLGYSFKYPSNLFYSELQSGNPQFHVSQKEADKAANCLKNRLGTLENPCSFGLFSVSKLDPNSDAAKEMERSIAYEENRELSSLTKYKDPIGREWKIEGPKYGLGGTYTKIEVNIDNTKHWFGINIWDSFMNPIKDSSTEEQLLFIKKLLSTFEFE